MNGIIDFITSPDIRGWINMGNGPSGKIEVWREDKLVAETEPNLVRADFASSPQVKGFHCVILGGYSLEELITQRMRVVWRNGHHLINIEIWTPLVVAAQIANMADTTLAHMMVCMNTQNVRRLREAAEKILGNGITQKTSEKLAPPYGSISKDNASIVGAGGHYFLNGGSNHVAEMYKKSEAGNATLNGWAEIIAGRSAWCRRYKIGYLQVFIPEKSSVIPQLVPYNISGSSTIWNEVLSQLSETPEVLDGYRLLKGSFSPEGTYRQQDTHLSTYGAMQMAVAIVEKITGRQITCRKITSQFIKSNNDLAKQRFDGFPDELVEPVELLNEVEINEALTYPPQLVKSFDPPEGLTGTIRVWKNDRALFPQRVNCFGNSFFERGTVSTTISWWLSRLFKEFHFIWSANIDYDYINHANGDFVICQTIERFLEKIPEK